MTPRSLLKHIEEIPEELMDVDMEYMLNVTEADDVTFIEDEYIGAIVWNDKEMTVKLCSTKTYEKFYKFCEKNYEQ